jgi:hypothetical protein
MNQPYVHDLLGNHPSLILQMPIVISNSNSTIAHSCVMMKRDVAAYLTHSFAFNTSFNTNATTFTPIEIDNKSTLLQMLILLIQSYIMIHQSLIYHANKGWLASSAWYTCNSVCNSMRSSTNTGSLVLVSVLSYYIIEIESGQIAWGLTTRWWKEHEWDMTEIAMCRAVLW